MSQSGLVAYGKKEIAYTLLYVERTTLEIAVHPDCSVVVKAPVDTKTEEVQQRVLKRAAWIRKQMRYFHQFDPRTPNRQFVGGETHLYMGRQYRLKISAGDKNSVKLIRGILRVESKSTESEAIKILLDKWYVGRARIKFQDSFEHCWPKFSKFTDQKPNMKIRRMKTRWGSLSKNGILSINPDLIRSPRECIDYVITHEMCHLEFHHHGPGFYDLLEKIMPDWEKRKHKLEMTLV